MDLNGNQLLHLLGLFFFQKINFSFCFFSLETLKFCRTPDSNLLKLAHFNFQSTVASPEVLGTIEASDCQIPTDRLGG